VPQWDTYLEPLRTKLQYLETKMANTQYTRFRQVWQQICALSSMQQQIVRELIRVDATMGARLVFKRENIHARVLGEVLTVFPCTPVMVDLVFWNYKVRDACYIYMPVVLNETVMFVIPVMSLVRLG
jgi:hypothetical protein